MLVFLASIGLLGLLFAVVSHQALAMPSELTWQQVNQDGFGDPYNSQLPSLQVFGDYLYTGVWHFIDPETASAEIWRSSTGNDWEKVDEREVNGTADMIVFDHALYAGSWDGHIWSSTNGISWTEVITDGFGDSLNGIARFALFDNELYVSTWNLGGTEIWRTSNGIQWEQFINAGLGNSNNNGAIASEIFQGQLYWGVMNGTDSAQVWRTNGITTTMVITHGFGITDNLAVSSLAVFGDDLYAGTWNKWGVEVWRTSDGLAWSRVLNGLDNPFGYEINALEVYRGNLYLVVQCDATGLQVWRTSNGIDWHQVGFAGFGDLNNKWSYWDNATTVFKDQLYIATNNFKTGGEVWQMTKTHLIFIPFAKE